MKIISVAGATSKAGKTLVAEQIIRYCSERYFSVYGVKFTTTSDLPSPCPRGAPCNVCDLSGQFRIIRDPQILMMPGKNTQRLAAAKASHVIWVISKKSMLPEAYSHLLSHLPEHALTVMEGSSITTLCRPDLLLYVFANHIPRARWKANAEEVFPKADFMLLNRKSKFPDALKTDFPGKILEADFMKTDITTFREVKDRIDTLMEKLTHGIRCEQDNRDS